MHLAEIGRPVFLADRLEHLDRGDAVVDAGLVAIVLQLDLDPVGEARARDAPCAKSCCSRLIVRPVTRQPISRAANSAKPPQPQPISSTWCFGPDPASAAPAPDIWRSARPRDRCRRAVEQRRRIGHGRVEPLLVERVAEIVMGVDVAARAAPACCGSASGGRAGAAGRAALPSSMLAITWLVDAEEFEEVGQVRAVPFAAQEGLRRCRCRRRSPGPLRSRASG